MDLEKALKKLGYIKLQWDENEKSKPPQEPQELIHRWYKEGDKWRIEYYIKNDKYH